MVAIVDGPDNPQEEKPSLAPSAEDVSLSNLYLPHMPSLVSASSPPTIRLLVCSDIDLQSSSALCEFLLEQRNELFDPTTIDMVLVSGPLTSESDLGSFGSQYRSRTRFQAPSSTALAKPFLESPESAAARLGMITACLSQLENIVCRVLYLMGATDPLLLSSSTARAGKAEGQQHQPRLTPNSRTLNQQLLSIAPGLGCAGLNYIEGLDGLLDDLREDFRDRGFYDDDTDEKDESDSTSRETAHILAQRIVPDSCRNQSYAEAVEDVLQLADPQRPLGEHRSFPTATVTNERWPSGSQTILATQYTRREIAPRSMQREEGSGDIHERPTSSCSDPRVCFEIASGVVTDKNKEPGDDRARWITPRRLLYPGSLRDRGDFVLVDVALCKKDNDDGAMFRWEVLRSEFRTLNTFR